MSVIEQLEESGLELKISDEDKSVLGQLNYQDVNALLAGTANKERMLKQPRLPDEKATDEEKARFEPHLHKYLGVPETPEGYKIVRPKEIPEGMIYEEDFEKAAIEVALKNKIPAKYIQPLAELYNERNIARYNAYKIKVQKDVDDFIAKDCGGSKEKFVEMVGDQNKKIVGKTTKALMQLSALCGLDYTDEKGNPQSRLIDCLELYNDGKGSLGDKLPLAKCLVFIYDNFFAEGKTHGGEPITQTAGIGEGRTEPYAEMRQKK